MLQWLAKKSRLLVIAGLVPAIQAINISFCFCSTAGEQTYRQAEALERQFHLLAPVSTWLQSRSFYALEKQARLEAFRAAADAYLSPVKNTDPFWQKRSLYRLARLIDQASHSPKAAEWPFEELKDSFFALYPKTPPVETDSQFTLRLLADDKQLPVTDPPLYDELQQFLQNRSSHKVAHRTPHPWLSYLKDGTIRLGKHRFWQWKTKSWRPIHHDSAVTTLRQQIQGNISDSRTAFALVALAKLKLGVSHPKIIEALNHPDPKVQLVGLAAAQSQPTSDLVSTVIAQYPSPARYGRGTSVQLQQHFLTTLKRLTQENPSSALAISKATKIPISDQLLILQDCPIKVLKPYFLRHLKSDNPLIVARALWGFHQLDNSSATNWKIIAKRIFELQKSQQ